MSYQNASSITLSARLLLGLAALTLGLTACGSNETIDAGAGSGGEPSEPTEQADTLPDATIEDDEMQDEAMDDEAIGEDVTPEPTEDASDGFTPIVPRSDLVSLQTIQPGELAIDPADDSRLLVRFEGAAEPCSGAAVTVTETETEVTVLLQTGLDPNAAAMSCIAQVFGYEMAIKLEQPLADRTLSAES